ncbi:unnamed protein product, partial [Closterium sp. NIES-53]
PSVPTREISPEWLSFSSATTTLRLLLFRPCATCCAAFSRYSVSGLRQICRRGTTS